MNAVLRAARRTFFFSYSFKRINKKKIYIYSRCVSLLRVYLARDTAVSLDKRIIDDYRSLLQLESYNSAIRELLRASPSDNDA